MASLAQRPSLAARIAALALVLRSGDCGGETGGPSGGAQRGGDPPHPFRLPLIFEAEDFVDPSGCWRRGEFNENMYAATFHNVFLSRRAFLGGPAGNVTEGQICTATRQVDIPAAGIYAPLVRFEAAYRFETMYRVEVEQCAPCPPPDPPHPPP